MIFIKIKKIFPVTKEYAYNAGNLSLIPGLGRSPGEGKLYPLQYSDLENSMDCIVHGVQRVGHDWVNFTLTHSIQFSCSVMSNSS